MKTRILNLIIFILILGLSSSLSAQQSVRQRLQLNSESNQDKISNTISVRSMQANRHQKTDIENAKWSRIIYRYLDLSKEKNAPLYYPVLPEDGRMNLFTMIFKLLANDEISSYEYLDGRELFTDEYKIDFVDFLNRFGIYFEEINGEIVVNDVDIPSKDVQGYFVKEAYYFDSKTSGYKVETLALCPVLLRQGDYDATTTRYPLFWLTYSDIMPYALGMPIMSSSINNSMTGTVDDFFRKRNYDGEIYKVANPRNLAIAQYAATAEDVKKEQEKIEMQLRDFEKELWRETIDSTKVDLKSRKSKTNKKLTRLNRTSSSSINSMRERRY